MTANLACTVLAGLLPPSPPSSLSPDSPRTLSFAYPHSRLLALPSDVLVCIYRSLSPLFLLSLSRACRSLAASLSPSCFRCHLHLNDLVIARLPRLASWSLVRVSSATSLSIEYGDAATELALASLFSTASPTSLLLFSSITSLSLRYVDAWVDSKPDTPTPLDRFLLLLSSASASSASSSASPRPLFPALASLTVHGVPYQETQYGHFSFSPLLFLPSLASIKVDMVFWQRGVLDPLLELPALQFLDLSECNWMLRGERSDEDEETERLRLVHRAADRGITLLPWQ
jgi:hypothetical protein